MSQEQVATAAGLTPKYVSQVENARANPSLLVLHALAEKGLKIPLAALFAYDTTGGEAQDDVRTIGALLAAQPRKIRRRALSVLRALVEPKND